MLIESYGYLLQLLNKYYQLIINDGLLLLILHFNHYNSIINGFNQRFINISHRLGLNYK